MLLQNSIKASRKFMCAGNELEHRNTNCGRNGSNIDELFNSIMQLFLSILQDSLSYREMIDNRVIRAYVSIRIAIKLIALAVNQ